MTGPEPGGPGPERDADGAGDPVCWLERVCDACGALEDGRPPPLCPRCGASRPAP